MADTSGAQSHGAEPDAAPARGDRRQLLRSDCASCFGLCCVALSFSRSSDFAIDKGAGEPCVNLQEDFGCGIHARLRSSGFRGCTVFECFGAGQKVAQGTFDGVSWRDDPATRASMFAVFPVMREVHELLWYLNEAVALTADPGVAAGAADDTIARAGATVPADAALRVEVLDVLERTERIADGAPEEILAADVHSHRDEVVELLGRVSAAVRASAPSGKRIKRVGPRADLMGARLAGADLRGVNLRGSYLIAADLHGADLRSADLIGADLRDTDLRGADLSTALFVTQPQLTAAIGDAATFIPPILERPAHWAV